MNYDKVANTEVVKKTKEALSQKGYEVFVVPSGNDALLKIKELIPEGKSVMNGSSTTLTQIGYLDLLHSGNHSWNDLHAQITAEDDETKRHELRRQSFLSDYYIGSVHALTQEGEFIVASNTGSQLPHIVSTSPHLIFVVSTKKIVHNVDEAIDRLNTYVVPLEDERMMKAYKMHTNVAKILIFKNESSFTGRKIHFILIEEDLGF